MILVDRTPGQKRGDTQSSPHLNRSLQLDLLPRSPEDEDTQERAKRRASITLELRNTPKGRLVYDREWSGEKASANTWQSVLEEVSEELNKMKVENVFECAQQCNENRLKAQLARKSVKIAGEAEVIKSPLSEQTPSPKKKRIPEQQEVLSTSPPTSPVDEQLLAMEHSRKREVAAANAQRYERLRAQRLRVAAEAESRMAEGRAAREARERAEEEERARRVEAQMRESEERWSREHDASAAALAAEERRNKMALDAWARVESAAREAGISEADIGAVATASDTLESAATCLEGMVRDQNARLKEEERAKMAAKLEKERLAKEQQAREEAAAQNARQEAAAQRAREEEAEQKSRQEAEKKLEPPPVVHQQQSQPQLAPSSEASERNRLLYEEHLGLKRQFTQLFASLEEDRTMKQFLFDCKKAINTPVNAITARSSADVGDKYEKLRLLLSGGEVAVPGDRRLCAATGHPQGLAYVRHLAARQFVLQGGEVLSSKMESGFGMAAVVVGLWAEFPDFGSAFLANLYEACPYLVPLNLSKSEGMSDREHRELLGFKAKDEGQLESREEYLRRIGGLAALYAAVCITTVTEEQLGAERAHPHGLGHIWRWLSSVLNLAPVTDVTATLVYQILRITGHDLLASYGPQFTRMLVVLIQRQLPLIKEVTLESGQGAVSRLEEFLQKTIETGRIAKPPKALNAGFV